MAPWFWPWPDFSLDSLFPNAADCALLITMIYSFTLYHAHVRVIFLVKSDVSFIFLYFLRDVVLCRYVYCSGLPNVRLFGNVATVTELGHWSLTYYCQLSPCFISTNVRFELRRMENTGSWARSGRSPLLFIKKIFVIMQIKVLQVSQHHPPTPWTTLVVLFEFHPTATSAVW